MKIIVSAAMSVDGYIDDLSPERLKLSGEEDWAEVLALRARCDAILVGAGTVRKDNPSLVIRDPGLRKERAGKGMDEDIAKVTLTLSGKLDPAAAFFTEGNGRKIVYAPFSAADEPLARIAGVAEVVRAEEITPSFISEDLSRRGYKTLMVEGGTEILTMFLSSGTADELRLAVAPFFVGEPDAPRLVCGGEFIWNKDNRMKLAAVEMLGETAVLHYKPYIREKMPQNNIHEQYMAMAVEQSRNCVPSSGAYSVGAVVVTVAGEVFAGYTHETGVSNHAEEEAVIKAKAAGAVLRGASVYSSMEPCSERKSKPVSCSRLIIDEGFAEVYYALPEPPDFVKCRGHEILSGAGIRTVCLHGFERAVEEINSHILNKK